MNDERQSTALIQRVKDETVQRVRADRKGAPQEVAAILKAIEKGLFDPGFDVNDLRRAFAPSPETLRAFRVRFGGTFKSYLTERLLEAAEPLVDDPAVDLAEIATGLGFSDPELFSKWFKRWTGDTPEQRCPARLTSRLEEPATEGPPIALWIRSRAWALGCGDAGALLQAVRARRSGARSP